VGHLPPRRGMAEAKAIGLRSGEGLRARGGGVVKGLDVWRPVCLPARSAFWTRAECVRWSDRDRFL